MQPKHDIVNDLRAIRPVRDEVVFIGATQQKAMASSGLKRDKNGYVGFDYQGNKSVYLNHYYVYIDDEDFGPIFIKICSYSPWGIKVCVNGQESARRQLEKAGMRF